MFTDFRGKSFQITGLNLRRRKYPVSATYIKSGKGYKFPTSQVKFSLTRAAA